MKILLIKYWRFSRATPTVDIAYYYSHVRETIIRMEFTIIDRLAKVFRIIALISN